MSWVDNRYICDDCRQDQCEECADCGEWHYRNNMYAVHDNAGNEVTVCNDCIDNYFYCEVCGEYHPAEEAHTVYKANGEMIDVCGECVYDFTKCPECGEYVALCPDGSCPHCGVVIEEKEDCAV